MQITVIGTGYVGLVSGTCFAESGNHVVCVDIDEHKVEKLRNGKIVIYEPGLENMFLKNIQAGRLEFTTNLKEGILKSDLIFLALPTPPAEDGSADLSYVLKVAEDIGKILKENPAYKVIINKSTVPVGTADQVREKISEYYTGDFDVVSNPEFLREGVAVEDFMKPDRVVIGTRSERAKQWMDKLYAPFVRQGNPVLYMDERSAEVTKYASNSYLALRISFMNELANLCEKVGADVEVVRRGMGSDTRIGKRFLFPGVGYGGSCFPKDVRALHKIGKDADYTFHLIESVMQVNDHQKLILSQKILQYFGDNLEGKTIAIWGISFKPNTDDIREAPALYIIEELVRAGARVRAFDPEAIENFAAYVQSNLSAFADRIEWADDSMKALEGADALAIITEWNVFRTPEFSDMKSLLKQPVIFDGRNLFDPEEMKEQGFYYNSIGRKVVE